MKTLKDKLIDSFIKWMLVKSSSDNYVLTDFDRLSYEIRPCDIVLVEGRTRASEAIKMITQSPWSHSALYIGRLHDVENPVLRMRLRDYFEGEPEEQLVIESEMGLGTVTSPLNKYQGEHLRVCRPKGLSRRDAQHVISFAIGQLGNRYHVKQIFDLMRFLLPWGLFPRRWRSSLFEHNAGESTKTVCSSMIAEAFGSVQFPILPRMVNQDEQSVKIIRKNPKLITPRDFDHSPFFEINKYPFPFMGTEYSYRHLPWGEDTEVDNDEKAVDLQSKISHSLQPTSDKTLDEPDINFSLFMSPLNLNSYQDNSQDNSQDKI